MVISRAAATPALFCAWLAGCGAPVTDPNASGLVRVADEPAALASLVNAAFLQTVDGINMGDYGYSRLESRVSTDRSCQTQAGSAFTLLDKAESRHAVVDDSESYYAKSDLTIKRSYQDAWTQNGALLACDPATRTIDFRPERLQQGNVRLQSEVSEEMNRILALTDKKQNQQLSHTLILKKSGARKLEFVNYADLGQSTSVEAQLSNQVSSTLVFKSQTPGEADQSLSLRLADSAPLGLTIDLNKNQEWTRYRIPYAQQDFLIPETGETLRLEFRNLIFTRESGCVPSSGQFAASVLQGKQVSITYSISFQPNAALTMRPSEGTQALALVPFGCVLKER